MLIINSLQLPLVALLDCSLVSAFWVPLNSSTIFHCAYYGIWEVTDINSEAKFENEQPFPVVISRLYTYIHKFLEYKNILPNINTIYYELLLFAKHYYWHLQKDSNACTHHIYLHGFAHRWTHHRIINAQINIF